MKIKTAPTAFFAYLIVCLLLVIPQAGAQNMTTVPFDSAHRNIQAKEITTVDFQGQHCISMLDGAVYLKDNFENGIVEFDISFGEGRSFPGLLFRIADAKNYEFLYLRPHFGGWGVEARFDDLTDLAISEP